jgi:hypothetical protein
VLWNLYLSGFLSISFHSCNCSCEIRLNLSQSKKHTRKLRIEWKKKEHKKQQFEHLGKRRIAERGRNRIVLRERVGRKEGHRPEHTCINIYLYRNEKKEKKKNNHTKSN